MGIVGPGGGGGGISEGQVLEIFAGTRSPGALKAAAVAAEAILEAALLKAIREKLYAVAGWTTLAAVLGAKVEAGARGVFARTEGTSAGTVVRLRGEVLVKNLEELKPGETLLTLPEGFRPERKQEIVMATSTAATVQIIIEPTGVITVRAAIKEKKEAMLDGITFPLN